MINLKTSIPSFLKTKLFEHTLSLADFSRKSGMPYNSIQNIHLGLQTNPDFPTILKIANFFNVSIDEMVGRDTKYFSDLNYTYNTLEIEYVTLKVREFLLIKINELNISRQKLSICIGFNSGFLSNLIQKYHPIKSLSTLSVCKIADYFEVSIDEMIGRISYDSKESDDISDNKNQDPQT